MSLVENLLRCCYYGRNGTPEERFFRKVEKKPNGCWAWTGSVNNYGYGHFRDEKKIQAHRWAYLHWKGNIPAGKILRHTCDTANCVNPDHLIPGTNKENSADAVARNRVGRSGGRLPIEKKVALMQLLKTDMPQMQIARVTGISIKTVQRHGSIVAPAVTKDTD